MIASLTPTGRRLLGSMSGHKYAKEFAQIQGCPPPCTPAQGVAFRFVHNPMTSRDFIPTAITINERKTCCEGWALSLFRDQAQAAKKFRDLVKKYKHIRNDLGGSLAQGTLASSHGEVTDPNQITHFSLYEFTGADLLPAFKIVAQL
jgi:hypothetical protein